MRFRVMSTSAGRATGSGMAGGGEKREEGRRKEKENQSIFVDMPQEVALKVVDVAGIVIFEGKVCGKMEIPVGHAGVYFLKCTAPDASFVKKVVVR